MPAEKQPKPPVGLDTPGKALWRRIVGAFELEPGELVQLEMAARQADDLARLEHLLAEQGLIVPGSMGQPRLNPAVTEARQARLALSKIIGAIALPDSLDRPTTASSASARRAALIRWSREA